MKNNAAGPSLSQATAIHQEEAAQQTNPRPDAFELQLIDAFQRELSGVRTQVYQLEEKIRRYDRAFESMFKEELERRVNGKDRLMGEACEVSPLERLKLQAENKATQGSLGRY